MVKQLAWTKRGILARNSGETKSFWDDTLSARDSRIEGQNKLTLFCFDNPPEKKDHRGICGGLLGNSVVL
jgi:hypothetical protein